MSIRADALLYALAVGSLIALPTRIVFLLIGLGGLIGGVLLLPSRPKYAVALLVGGAVFLALGIRTVILGRREAIRQAEAAAEDVRRSMHGRR